MNYRDYQPQWKEASISLPTPMWAFTPTIAGDYVIIVGYVHCDDYYRKYFQISVQKILSSVDLPTFTWMELSPAMHYHTATVPYSNPPVIIGGKVHSNQGDFRTSDIALYSISKKSWRKVGSLTSARSSVGVALINATIIIVIGGCTSGAGVEGAMLSSITKVEIGNIVSK